MYNPFSLEGKTVLITGASSGIGRATAIECSRLGARVIITGRNQERLEQTIQQLEGEDHSYYICDLNNEVEIDEMVASLPEVQGLVNNAGFTKILPLQFVSKGEIDSVLQTNTVAPILLLQKLLKKKKLKKDSSVVFTSSLAGIGACTVGNSMYVASKGAISAFVHCAALELAPKRIRVNAVCPGMVDTGILNSGVLTEEQIKKDEGNYPLGRYGKPEEIAWSIVYLLSDASGWTTGDNLVIDGGMSLH